jgi:hypothetical protein
VGSAVPPSVRVVAAAASAAGALGSASSSSSAWSTKRSSPSSSGSLSITRRLGRAFMSCKGGALVSKHLSRIQQHRRTHLA